MKSSPKTGELFHCDKNDKIKNTVNVMTLMKEDLEILRDAKDDERYWVEAQEVKEKYIK